MTDRGQQQAGPVQVWYLAICQDCTPVLPQPFSDEGERDRWAEAHRAATGDRVWTAMEVRA
jgi:hypothetical protein